MVGKSGEKPMENVEWGGFCRLFGKTPRNKIFEFFLAMQELDFTIGDVARETGLNRATTYNTMEELIEEMYIIPTRKVSGGQLYKLNIQKKEIKILIKVFNIILKNIVDKHTKQQKQIVYA